jgi:hypothetical protein
MEGAMTTRKSPAKPRANAKSDEDDAAKVARDLQTAGKQQLDESLARERARQRAGSDD